MPTLLKLIRKKIYRWDTWNHTLTTSPQDRAEPGAQDTQRIKVNYVQYGNNQGNPPVVFVHGFGASAFQWRYQIADLASTNRVYALDLMGFGLSDKPNISYSNEYWGQQIQDFITQVVGEPAVLVGNSLGGIMCLQAATRQPDQTLALVLINIPGNYANVVHEVSPLSQPEDESLLRRVRRTSSALAMQSMTTLRRLYSRTTSDCECV